jgi:hypothetical protein
MNAANHAAWVRSGDKRTDLGAGKRLAGFQNAHNQASGLGRHQSEAGLSLESPLLQAQAAWRPVTKASPAGLVDKRYLPDMKGEIRLTMWE